MRRENERAGRARKERDTGRERAPKTTGDEPTTPAKKAELRAVVEGLRDLSDRLKALSRPGDRWQTFFPAREPGETQPIRLENYVDLEDIAELIHYVADMMEE